MPEKIYITAISILIIILLALAIIIEDIGSVFEFNSAFAISNISFIFPGYFYIRASNKFDREN